jgi:branched-subunit amino acid aminotransferase/4-amino-4-deoxychorismate lyase
MPVPIDIAEPLAYLNGEFLLHREAKLPIWDMGIVQGVTVTEAVRTFRHQPYRLEQHLARLTRSMDALGLEPQESLTQLQHIAQQLVGFNSSLIEATNDLAVIVFVTAGESALHAGEETSRAGRPTVCIYAYPLALRAAARGYEQGLSLVIPGVRHIPPAIIDPRIKYRSRLHWYLADREVRATNPAAEALLLDQNGFVTETAKGNLFVLKDGQLMTPRPDTTLGGVSQDVVMELAVGLGLECHRADLTPQEVGEADEVWISSTTTCLMPVASLNSQPISTGRPGPVFRQIIGEWSKQVGVDIVAQAVMAAQRPHVC